MKLSQLLGAAAASTLLFAVPIGGTVALFPLLATPAVAGPGDHQAEAGGQQKGHKQNHVNGHNLLGEKIHQDGKHDIGKVSGRTVSAEVKGGKVVNMTVGDLKVTKVKSNKKMANAEAGFLRAAYVPGVQLAQYQETTTYYDYGYCVDDGYETTCYWYPPSDVYTSSSDWVDYSTYSPY
jgi:hypothetical protein